MACTLLRSRYLVLGLLFNREVIKVDGFGDGRDIPNQPKRPRMPGNWFNRVHKKFLRQSHRNIVVPHSNACSGLEESRASNITEEIDSYGKGLYIRVSPSSKKELTKEDFAAIKIQAIFRGHLARRAFRALRSLVKLQALVRGAYVRKQSGIALQYMHAVVRLQVRIRARQLLSRCSDN